MDERARADAFLRVDMHCHSRASFDSLNRPEQILQVARSRGMDRVVITDHNEIEGARLLHEMDPERILIGEEVRTREGVDIIGIFLRELIPRHTPARETCERIRAQGGVVYLPHPFDVRRAGGGALLKDLADLIDVVEVHNARSWKRGLNARAEEWALSHGKRMGAGSDAHALREIGRGYVEVPPFEPRRDSFLAALTAGRVAGRTVSSPFCHVWSTYAKLRKRLPGA
ncbi:MAG: PHP domain-containing protein [Gemmatimonadetes bacterium]|nr:PHP domain-containing protein [Gemmatimonadota bacterium]